MPASVHVEKLANKYSLTVFAETSAEAMALVDLLLGQKSPEAFKPAPPLTPEAAALLDRADSAEVD
jgi:hypothetical protein